MKPLRYVFYRVLDWKMKDPRESQPVLVASISIAVLMVFNLLSLEPIARLLWHVDLRRQEIRSLAIVVYVAVIAFVQARWVASGQYISFCEEFARETRMDRRRHTVWVMSYIVLSVVLLFASFYFFK